MSAERADPTTSTPFAARVSVEQAEERVALALDFDAGGLIPRDTIDADTGKVPMPGFMTGEALQRTIVNGDAHPCSLSGADREGARS